MVQEPLAYNTNLRAPITTEVNSKPKARVHSREWQKIMNAEPVEINPSVGYGYKVRMKKSCCLTYVMRCPAASMPDRTGRTKLLSAQHFAGNDCR